MSYGLGVDLGTTFTAAAVARDGRVEMATLGDHTDAVPSVVLIRADGTVLTGGAAERRAAAEPDRVARSVKRRFGDPVPVILGGTSYTAAALMAHQLRAVADLVSGREGGRPAMVTLTYPASWGPYKRELFAQVPGLAGLGGVRMLTEPEAAAAHYARSAHLDPGALVAVYDLGGGTFDATVLRTAEHGFDILGRPQGIEGLGGVDFDEAVFTHVDRALDGAVSRLDPADPRATSAAIRLRRECVTAKETLSADTETTIAVLLPGLQTEVRLTRGEFEKMIRPAIDATIASLRRALDSAGIDPRQLHTVLLVGGSSRIPMVAHLVSAELGRPTSVDTHPKHAIALGAAAAGAATARAAAAAAAPVRLTPPAGKAQPAQTPAPAPRTAAAAPALAPTLAAAPALAAPADRRHRRLRWRRGHSPTSLEVRTGDRRVRGGEPEGSIVASSADAAGTPVPEQRFLQGRFPERVRLGEEVTLLVRLGLQPGARLEAGLAPLAVARPPAPRPDSCQPRSAAHQAVAGQGSGRRALPGPGRLLARPQAHVHGAATQPAAQLLND